MHSHFPSACAPTACPASQTLNQAEATFFPVNSSPTFRSSRAKYQRFLPNGGAAPTFSEQALVQLQRIAICMRQHGISDFPDPKRAPADGPSSVDSGYRITDYRGVLLEFPATITMQAPAYKQAAATCGASFLVL